MFLFIIIILILIIIYIILIYPQTEHYQNLYIYPTRLLGMHKFSKLKNGKIVFVDIKPIQPTKNESQCIIKPCPAWWNDNMTCFECS